MELGNRIKKFREKINMSQEELADKVYTSRQTISNWENDKTYPDINSLKLLSNIFDVSLDNLIEGDIENMKKTISESDRKGFVGLSRIYTIELIAMVISAYPLLKYAGVIGIAIWILFTIITIITAFEIEKIKKEYNIQTYKEIVAFYNNKSLTRDEKIEEKAKIPYQRFLLSILSAIIAIIVFVLLEVLIG
ncbi:MAG: helix-turn-helix transcriptional regulator [Bacilli bacterium]|nr:helix-turn-helix transcriptional regulator [Bacilli bacterium]